jgi:hypothetical protein
MCARWDIVGIAGGGELPSVPKIAIPIILEYWRAKKADSAHGERDRPQPDE